MIKKILPKKFYKNLCRLYDFLRYLINLPRYYYLNSKFKKYKIYSEEQTIDLIIEKKLSLCRFGDGEIKWILGKKQQSFQDNNPLLSKRLLEVLTSNNKNILIGIPKQIQDISSLNISAKSFWVNFTVSLSKELFNLLNVDYNYCNASITRPYMDYKNKNVEYKFQNLKKMWNNREVVVIEGNFTRLGVNNDLFDNVKSLKRIICPSTNAFSKYNEILCEAKKIDSKKLILIALGPTATVLAYDLAMLGYQAIDIGHIDIEYEWFLKKAKKKCAVLGKYTNEANQETFNQFDNNKEYVNSIIKKI